MKLMYLLIFADMVMLGLALTFTIESIHEKEPRATKFGGAGVFAALVILVLIIWTPAMRLSITVFFLFGGLFILICLIPGKPNPRLLKGSTSYMLNEGKRFDERDIVFARARMTKNGSSEQAGIFRRYYEKHPEKEEPDAERRNKGLIGKLGKIDNCQPSSIAMTKAGFDIPNLLGPHAVAQPQIPKVDLSPEKATDLVKNFARHIGADLVGICKLNPQWVYSFRGELHYENWNDWGKPLEDFPPFAVVMLTEMDREHVSSAPHTPSVAESANDYAKGAYISTVLARFFAHMGCSGVAQHNRHYDTLMVPLAIDAGLGELGRQGYLIAPKYGARVRIFATLTDMELIPDRPISIGAEEFCSKCKKCAEACPSRSIPSNEKVLYSGVEKWKLDEELCFDYWSKIGTDCAICMAICPFSRPYTFSHIIVRWLVARSPVVQKLFPILDNWIYGKKWRPRKVSPWLDYTTRTN